MRFIKIIIVILIIILFAIIYTQNIDVFTHTFEVKLDLKNYMVGPYLTKNIVLILSAFALGGVVTLIFGAMQSISAKSELKSIKRRVRELEADNQRLSEQSHHHEHTEPEAEESSSGTSPFAPPSDDD